MWTSGYKQDNRWVWYRGNAIESTIPWATSFPTLTDWEDFIYIKASDNFKLANQKGRALAVPLCEIGNLESLKILLASSYLQSFRNCSSEITALVKSLGPVLVDLVRSLIVFCMIYFFLYE